MLAKRVVDKSYDIEIYFADDDEVPKETSVRVLRSGRVHDPIRAGVQRDSRDSTRRTKFELSYKIFVWGTFAIYASILLNSDLGGPP